MCGNCLTASFMMHILKILCICMCINHVDPLKMFPRLLVRQGIFTTKPLKNFFLETFALNRDEQRKVIFSGRHHQMVALYQYPQSEKPPACISEDASGPKTSPECQLKPG